jgi:hypothetical protein
MVLSIWKETEGLRGILFPDFVFGFTVLLSSGAGRI